MARAKLALGAVAALAAGSIVAAPPAAVHTMPIITLSDSGKTYTVPSGRQLSLRLTHRYRWTSLKVSSTAVRLVPVAYIRDPGYSEWMIRTRAAGTSRISAVGYGEARVRECDPGPCSPHLFRVTIVVR